MVIATCYERGTVTKLKSIFKPAWQHVGADESVTLSAVLKPWTWPMSLSQFNVRVVFAPQRILCEDREASSCFEDCATMLGSLPAFA